MTSLWRHGRCDALEVGDVIVTINGKKTAWMKHAEVVNLLQTSTLNPTVIEVEYSLPDPRKYCNVIDVSVCLSVCRPTMSCLIIHAVEISKANFLHRCSCTNVGSTWNDVEVAVSIYIVANRDDCFRDRLWRPQGRIWHLFSTLLIMRRCSGWTLMNFWMNSIWQKLEYWGYPWWRFRDPAVQCGAGACEYCKYTVDLLSFFYSAFINVINFSPRFFYVLALFRFWPKRFDTIRARRRLSESDRHTEHGHYSTVHSSTLLSRCKIIIHMYFT